MKDDNDISLMLQYGDSLIQHSMKILETPAYALAPVEGAKFGSTMVQGGTFCLGALLMLWGYSDLKIPPLPSGEPAPLWRIQDSENKAFLHIFYMGGSLGSGSNSYSAFNFAAQKIVSGRDEDFGSYFASAANMMRILKEKYGEDQVQHNLIQVIEQLGVL